MTEVKAFSIIGRCGLARKANIGLSELQLASEWKAVDTIRAVSFPPMADLMRKIFRRQEKRVMQMIDNLHVKEDTIGNILSWLIFSDSEEKGLEAMIFRIMGRGSDAGLIRLGLGLELENLTSDDPEAFAIAQMIMRQSRRVNDTTRRRISEQIQAGLVNDESKADIVGRVRSVFTNATESRARMIAQTTGTGAFEAGQVVSFRRSGVWGKRWLSERDARVRGRNEASRYDHWKPDGQKVAVDQPFVVSGERLMFPADPSLGATAGNVINCRCTTLPVRKQPKEPEPTE